MSDTLWAHGLYSPWISPGQNTGVGSLSLLQGIFPTQGLNLGLLHCRRILYQLNHKGFSSIHVWMWELDHKEGWALKNLCFQTVVLEKTLESPLDSKEIKLVNPKRNQFWIFTGKTNAESWSCNTLATWCEELIDWKRHWCWERLRAGREGGKRGWDGWMASLTQNTWV